MQPASKAISLQSKLIKTSVLSSVVAGICALLVMLGISVYQTMTIQDEIMDEIADMLLVNDLSANVGQQVDELSEQFDIQYQLKLDQLTLTESEEFYLNLSTAPFILPRHEFAFSVIEGTLYRTYSTQDEHLKLQLYQPIHARFNQMLESALSLLGILVLLWLIQWLILHFAIRKQLRSLKNLSQDISLKNAHDLSPVQQHQPELKELQPIILQLNKMLNRVETSLMAEQRFTADASHELRSPLSAIHLRLQLLKRKYQHHELVDDLESIHRDVIRGTNVLENLLLLARLDPTDATDLVTQQVQVDELVLDVVKALEPFIRDKSIQIDPSLQYVAIIGNQELMFTALRNVIDNAVRYCPERSQISIELRSTQHQAEICVSNQGDYLSEHVIHRLGERFYRELGTKTQGSGLGLSICKKIIELHHGQIKFDNPADGGLIVTLTLPTTLS